MPIYSEKSNDIIITRTPLKMSFFGGGTDLPDFSRKYGGCVVGTAIDKYLYVAIREREDSMITLDTPFGHETCSTVHQLKHPLVQAILENIALNPDPIGDAFEGGVSIWITTDMPAHGCGLGTSSALMVGLLAGLSHIRRRPKRQWTIAQQVAAIQLRMGGSGVQDAYLCALGGTRYFEFNPDDSVTVKDLPDLDSSELMLFDTGFARDSRGVQSEKKSEEQLMQIKQLAQAFVSIENSQEEFPTFLKQTWELKRLVSSSISNERLDEIYDAAVDAGADAGKLLGAGNGGHFVFHVKPKYQGNVRQRLSDMGLKEVPFNFDRQGVHVDEV